MVSFWFVIIALVLGVFIGFFISKFSQKESNLSPEIVDFVKKIKDRELIDALMDKIPLIQEGVSDVQNTINLITSGGARFQGPFGQMVLKNILERNLGWREGHEFVVEEAYKSDDGDVQKPDVIANFPDGKQAVIDSKVSLSAWKQYREASDNVIKDKAKKDHIASIKRHIDDLSKKHYSKIKDINTFDTVIMFMPVDEAISTLGKESQNLIEYALSKKITLVGPAMLYYCLRIINHLWQVEKQSKNIEEVVTMAENLSSQAVDIYNAAKKSKTSIDSTIKGLDEVMNKIQDGRGSFLGKISKLVKLGGLSPKKEIPHEIKEKLDGDDK